MTAPRGPGAQPDRHREVRERLGQLVLGALPAAEQAAVRAHLDGCAACRGVLADLQPLAADLRLADPEHLAGLPTPPADLGARIMGAVRAETVLRDRRQRAQDRRRRLRAIGVPALTAAAAAAATVLVLTLSADPPPAAAPPVPTEQLTVRAVAPQVQVSSAVLVPHTWGVEVRIVAAGLVDGRAYRGVVRDRTGRERAAGEFLGTGARTLTCNLQAAVLRDDAAGFSVVDERGAPVVQVSL